MALRKRRPGLVYPTWEEWHYVGATDEPAFENSWSNIGTYSAMAFRLRETGIVDLVGAVEHSGDTTLTIATLPVGYRPTDVTFLTGRSESTVSSGACVLGIETNGEVRLYSTASQYVWFAGSYFLDAAAP